MYLKLLVKDAEDWSRKVLSALRLSWSWLIYIYKDEHNHQEYILLIAELSQYQDYELLSSAKLDQTSNYFIVAGAFLATSNHLCCH